MSAPKVRTAEAIAAKVQGLKRYVPRLPCLHGHWERYVGGNGCCECAADSRRKWRLANLERDRARNRARVAFLRAQDPEGYRKRREAWRSPWR